MTAREVRFANAYIEHGNSTRAVREAGYLCASEQAFWQMGSMLLRKPQVADYLRTVMGEYLDAQKVTVPKIARRLEHIAFGDRTGMFDDAGEVLNPREWPEELRASILSFEIKTSTDRITGLPVKTYKAKFANPTEALRLLGDWRRMTGTKALAPTGDAEKDRGITVILEAVDGTQTVVDDDDFG